MNGEEKKEFLRIKAKYKQTWLDNFDMDFLINLLEKIQKENEYLQYKLRKKICVEAHEQVKQNYIAKNIIKDKIEELNKEIKSCDEIDAIFKIKQQQILRELLESEV